MYDIAIVFIHLKVLHCLEIRFAIVFIHLKVLHCLEIKVNGRL